MIISYTVLDNIDMAKPPACFATCCVAVNVGSSNE